ncbi:TPA: hypothetical protein O5S09_001707 [Staphylococcus aureus]|uniref:hypothetical protein n=1 Tax=Staphylococcus aureus TaxID=1280 RepID=UPI000921F5EE|nr:hypothetical protein [Staphylococcus aureus]UVJ09194.1 DUF4145 domain-containing protein [Staphylococcus aureus]SGU90011.1 Uncharacterised protein [Staphylococcus aureus]HAR6696907.1 DUF4145 domain-containing protein [Staphylococcus aureus]HBE8007370.1 hypothetical protein [Staphylococcus aureus]HCY8224304.1 hypothetical protein [Staphylococcus aureus]
MSNYKLSVPITINNQSSKQYIDIKIALPKSCPYCDQVQTPIVKSSSGLEQNESVFSVIFICNECNQHFLKQYKKNVRFSGEEQTAYPVYFKYEKTTEYFSETLKECSPEFIKIYSQLIIAEKHNLNDLLKLGYRKAIEQLVWDYLIKFGNKTENSLQKKSFSDRINLLDLPQRQWLSDLIAWIGNDGAHPYQRHETLTIEDMKRLSSIVITNIETLIEQHKYESYHTEHK